MKSVTSATAAGMVATLTAGDDDWRATAPAASGARAVRAAAGFAVLPDGAASRVTDETSVSACATAVPPATAEPTPSARAPAPSQQYGILDRR